MNCIRCGRPLSRAARTINSRQGPLAWGRACAIKDGLIHPKPRPRALVTHDAGEVDERQVDWVSAHAPEMEEEYA